MEKIISGRGTGKTKQLMEIASQNNGIFVCQNALHMREKANAYGFHKLNIISYRDFIDQIKCHPISYSDDMTIKGFKDSEGRLIYIDELEGFVQHICLNRFSGYSLSLE